MRGSAQAIRRRKIVCLLQIAEDLVRFFVDLGCTVALRFAGVVAPRWWGPLIDGVYAIVLTLLVIELPRFLLEVLRDFNHGELGLSALVNSLVRIVAGYLAVFLVVCDMWTKKKSLLEISERFIRHNNLEKIAIIFSLFLVTLLPPMYYVFSEIEQGRVKLGRFSNFEQIEYNTINASIVLIIVLIYTLIGFGASRRFRQIKQKLFSPSADQAAQEEMRDACAMLRGVRFDTLIRIVAAPVIVVLLRTLHIPHTPWPGLLYGLTGLWHFELKDHRS